MMTKKKLCLIMMVIAMLLTTSLVITTSASTITISDGDVAGLIAAIIAANDEGENPGPDTIELAPGGNYTLSEIADSVEGGNGLPAITSAITINGNGATIIRSQAEGIPIFRIIYVGNSGNLTLNDTTLSNGATTNIVGGGGIRNLSTLLLNHSIITGNSAGSEQFLGSGGGISNSRYGRMTISDSTISNNKAYNTGGGIVNGSVYDVWIIDSVISENKTFRLSNGNGDGAGIHTQVGTMIIVNTAIIDNQAEHVGGGILNNNSGGIVIENSTISGNSTNYSVSGTGIDLDRTTAIINNSTIAFNVGPGGSAANIRNRGKVRIKNSIIVNAGGTNCTGGGYYIYGTNFADDGSCQGFTRISLGQLALLPLADNGGPTPTHALEYGSVAIDAATDCTTIAGDLLTVDQRGVSRPLDGNDDSIAVCDVGAYEAYFNEPPVAEAGGPYSAIEGENKTLNGIGSSDPDNNIISYKWDFDNDGEFDDAVGVAPNISFIDNGTYQISLLVTDSYGESDVDTTEIVVNNAPPTVDAGEDIIIYSGENANFSATFNDVGVADIHTASIDFGDGSGLIPALVDQGVGQGSVTASHVYYLPYIYEVTICVTDNDLGTGCDLVNVEVMPIPITIDIKPDGVLNSINCNNKNAMITVAIISTPTFEAMDVDHSSVTFEGALEAHWDNHKNEPKRHEKDINEDGLLDLVFHFRLEDTTLQCDSSLGALIGELFDGRYFIGVDSVNMIDKKR